MYKTSFLWVVRIQVQVRSRIGNFRDGVNLPYNNFQFEFREDYLMFVTYRNDKIVIKTSDIVMAFITLWVSILKFMVSILKFMHLCIYAFMHLCIYAFMHLCIYAFYAFMHFIVM